MTTNLAELGSTAIRQRGGREAIVVIVVFVGALGVTLIASWLPSFWWDEAATLRLAALSEAQFIEFIGVRDIVHTVYGGFMHAWIAVFGDSEFAVRFPSAVAVASSAASVYFLTRQFGGSTVSSASAAVIFVFLPRIIVQGIEARSYAGAVALVTGAAVLVVCAAGRGALGLWVAYVGVATVGVWWFAYVALVLPAFAILADSPDLPRRERVWRLLTVVAFPVMLGGPLVLLMMRQAGQVDWLAGQELNFYTVLIEPVFGWAAWLPVIVLLILGAGVWRGRLRWTRVSLAMVTWAALPVIALIVVTLAYTPIFTPRYLAISAPAVAILCGIAMTGWRWRAVLVVSLIWIVAAMPFYISSRLPTAKPGGLDLRTVATTIGNGTAPGDGFLLSADGFSPVRARVAAAAYPAQFARLRDLALVQPYVGTGTYWDVLRIPTTADLDQVDRVWVASYEKKDPFAEVLAAAGFHRTLVATVTGIEVARWQR